MSLYALHLANGRTSNTGVFRLMGRLLSGSGVIESTAFTVSAQGTPDMTVKVSGSTAADNLVIITSGGDTYHGWNTANANVTITSNATGVTKKDHIVAYVDTALSTVTPDNPTGLVLIAVRGTGTAAPTDGEINTVTGTKPWIRLAEVSVSNGASSINSGNITDNRTISSVPARSLPAIQTASFDFSLTNGAVTSLDTALVQGSISNGTFKVGGTVSLTSLSIPAAAKILSADVWVIGAGNIGSVSNSAMAVTTLTNSSLNFVGMVAGNDTGFMNNTNSHVKGYIRYIA